MTSLPDWLVERAALDEAARHRARLDAADPAALSERITALAAQNAAELAAYPAGPAVAQIEARITAARRRRQVWMLGALTTAAVMGLALLVVRPASPSTTDEPEVTRAKGAARVMAFRLAGDHVEKLDADALAKPGDIIQLRYSAGGQHFGMIASIDGAGAVTLHFPADEGASTELAAKTVALPNAYELDAAPDFERFFFITSDEAIDVAATLDALRDLARQDDAATAKLEGLRHTSLRLRKPTSNPKAPTP